MKNPTKIKVQAVCVCVCLEGGVVNDEVNEMIATLASKMMMSPGCQQNSDFWHLQIRTNV